MPETYHEKLTRLAGLADAYKNGPKGFAGARGSRSCFPVTAEPQIMIMFCESQAPDVSRVRDALLIIGWNNGITEPQQSYTLVTTTASNPAALTLVRAPNVVVDEIAYIPPAIPPELSLKKYREGRRRDDDIGDKMMAEALQAALRFGINLAVWTGEQLRAGKGPGVGPAGIPVLPLD